MVFCRLNLLFKTMAIDAGDEILEKHFETSSSKVQYTSSIIQNELIDIYGKIIVEKLVYNINGAECFTALADETTDISGQEQFPLCVRYIDDSSGSSILREDF